MDIHGFTSHACALSSATSEYRPLSSPRGHASGRTTLPQELPAEVHAPRGVSEILSRILQIGDCTREATTESGYGWPRTTRAPRS